MADIRTVTVPEGVTSIVVVEPGVTDPLLSTNWNTTAWVSATTATTFTVSFGTPAPASAKLTYAIELPVAVVAGTPSVSGAWGRLKDLKADVLRRSGEKTDGASEYDGRALDYINRAFLRILQEGVAYPWLRKVGGVFNTVPKITTGTLLVTKGAAGITFSVSPSVDVIGRKLRVDGKGPVYRIKTHGSGTTATLDAAYVDDTNASAPYVMFQDEYALATDVLFLLMPLRFYEDPYRLNVVDENAMEDLYPLSLIVEGTPQLAALIGEQRIRLSHYTADLKRIEYDYIQILSDVVAGGSLPMPLPDRKALASGALYYLLMDKEDSRADAAGLEFNFEIGLMRARYITQKVKSSRAFGQIRPRLDGKGSKFREGPVRTASGLIIG